MKAEDILITSRYQEYQLEDEFAANDIKIQNKRKGPNKEDPELRENYDSMVNRYHVWIFLTWKVPS